MKVIALAIIALSASACTFRFSVDRIPQDGKVYREVSEARRSLGGAEYPAPARLWGSMDSYTEQEREALSKMR